MPRTCTVFSRGSRSVLSRSGRVFRHPTGFRVPQDIAALGSCRGRCTIAVSAPSSLAGKAPPAGYLAWVERNQHGAHQWLLRGSILLSLLLQSPAARPPLTAGSLTSPPCGPLAPLYCCVCLLVSLSLSSRLRLRHEDSHEGEQVRASGARSGKASELATVA